MPVSLNHALSFEVFKKTSTIIHVSCCLLVIFSFDVV